MTDVRALNRVLPATGIETDCLAQIHGLRYSNELDFLVPPAGWDEPAVGVTELLAFALTEAGHTQVGVNGIAAEMASTLLAGLSMESRPVMIGWPSDGAVCCSVSEGTRALSAMGRRGAEVAKTLKRFADEAACARVFTHGEFGQHTRSLRELGPHPLQSGLTEFWPGIELCAALDGDDTPSAGTMRDWMEGMRLEIEALEAEVGTRLFHVATLGYPPDDNEGHRFLALDYLCYAIPNSSFVEYLVKVADAPSAEGLRAALRAPTAYSFGFRLSDSFLGPQVCQPQQFQMPA